MKINWKQTCTALTIGLLIGGGLGRWSMMKPHHHKHGSYEKRHERKINKLAKKLDLNESQKTEISRIFKEKHKKVRAIKKKAFDEIRPLLDDSQQEKFDAMRERWKQRHKK